MVSDRQQLEQCQRIEVSKCVQGTEKLVKISLERYDQALGWYTAGALCLPLHQLPLLEQAIQNMSDANCTQCTETSCPNKVIAFPMMTRSIAEASVETAS